MLTRRQLLRCFVSLPFAGALPRLVRAATSARVVVVGGGFGGATCAKYLRIADPTLAVTVV
ncbi:MAG TPA: cytochrome C, partial [Methylomirabilota bacterium]|nr:cytochrome C [Methylomirabilota bacterium]